MDRQQLHTACWQIAHMLARILPEARKPKCSAEKKEQAIADEAAMIHELQSAGLDLEQIPLAVGPLSRFFRCELCHWFLRHTASNASKTKLFVVEWMQEGARQLQV
jgi:hypothetical protein